MTNRTSRTKLIFIIKFYILINYILYKYLIIIIWITDKFFTFLLHTKYKRFYKFVTKNIFCQLSSYKFKNDLQYKSTINYVRDRRSKIICNYFRFVMTTNHFQSNHRKEFRIPNYST